MRNQSAQYQIRPESLQGCSAIATVQFSQPDTDELVPGRSCFSTWILIDESVIPPSKPFQIFGSTTVATLRTFTEQSLTNSLAERTAASNDSYLAFEKTIRGTPLGPPRNATTHLKWTPELGFRRRFLRGGVLRIRRIFGIRKSDGFSLSYRTFRCTETH